MNDSSVRVFLKKKKTLAMTVNTQR